MLVILLVTALTSLSPPLLLQLIIGDYGLSFDEQRAQMAIWSILAAVSHRHLTSTSITGSFHALLTYLIVQFLEHV